MIVKKHRTEGTSTTHRTQAKQLASICRLTAFEYGSSLGQNRSRRPTISTSESDQKGGNGVGGGLPENQRRICPSPFVRCTFLSSRGSAVSRRHDAASTNGHEESTKTQLTLYVGGYHLRNWIDHHSLHYVLSIIHPARICRSNKT